MMKKMIAGTIVAAVVILSGITVLARPNCNWGSINPIPCRCPSCWILGGGEIDPANPWPPGPQSIVIPEEMQ